LTAELDLLGHKPDSPLTWTFLLNGTILFFDPLQTMEGCTQSGIGTLEARLMHGSREIYAPRDPPGQDLARFYSRFFKNSCYNLLLSGITWRPGQPGNVFEQYAIVSQHPCAQLGLGNILHRRILGYPYLVCIGYTAGLAFRERHYSIYSSKQSVKSRVQSNFIGKSLSVLHRFLDYGLVAGCSSSRALQICLPVRSWLSMSAQTFPNPHLVHP
jgi:hypothetical protein